MGSFLPIMSKCCFNMLLIVIDLYGYDVKELSKTGEIPANTEGEQVINGRFFF